VASACGRFDPLESIYDFSLCELKTFVWPRTPFDYEYVERRGLARLESN